MTFIFAIFFCNPSFGYCERVGSVALTFDSLKACQVYVLEIHQHAFGDFVDGRMKWGDTGSWYECRSKRIDTWESAR